MTLQERLRESAKELVRLLEEDMKAKKWMPEARKVAQMNIAEARRFLQRINLKEDTELEIRVVCLEKPAQNLSIDNGKAFEAKIFKNEHNPVHNINQQSKDIPEAGKEPNSNDLEDGIPCCLRLCCFQAVHRATEPERKSENHRYKEGDGHSFVDKLIQESVQIVPLELVRINKPSAVLVKDPDTGTEIRCMMTLTWMSKGITS